MFDVLNDAERAAVRAANPDSFLHVTGSDVEGPAALQRLLAHDAYAPARDVAYAYRMREGARTRTGVVVLVALAGFADGQVLGHEGIQAERVERLVASFDAVPYRSDLVSLLQRDERDLADIIAGAMSGGPAALQFNDVTGVEQAVSPLPEAEGAAVAELVARQRLYVADGHHRVAASLLRWVRAGRPGDPALPCVVYAESQVELYAFHRRVCGPVVVADLLAGLTRAYDLRPAAGPTHERRALGVYLDGGWWRAEPLVRQTDPGVAGLDVTTLDARVLGPLLGVHPGDPRLEPVPELRGVEESVRRCDDDGGVLFTLRSPTVNDLVEVAERGEVMSAKTTYVQPKPRTGIFLADAG
jgi:uncharacterized protein (DUF1015 family)